MGCARLVALCLLLAGCASSLPTTVQVPVSVPCVPESAPRPPSILSNDKLAQLDDRTLVLTIRAEHLELGAYAAQIAPIVESCR